MAGVSQRLELRQGQALVMTPQLLQAIKLLQLSTIELATYVENELERNPLLERVEEGDAPVSPEPRAEAAAEPQSGDWLAEDMTPSREAIEERLGTGLDNVFQDERPTAKAERAEDPALGLSATSWSGVGAGQTYDGELQDFESYTAAELSLHDRLIEQLHIATGDAGIRMIGLTLIDAIDDTGYCREDLDEIAERLGVPLMRVEEGLTLIQTFEPTGVGARNLVECLRLQLAERNRLDPAMAALLDNLPLLARRDFASLRKLCGVVCCFNSRFLNNLCGGGIGHNQNRADSRKCFDQFHHYPNPCTSRKIAEAKINRRHSGRSLRTKVQCDD